MFIQTVTEFSTQVSSWLPPSVPAPGRVLMVTPEHFRVEYAINPHMKTATGALQKVDLRRAMGQWETLRGIYQKLGYGVELLGGQQEFPDMVFAANQSFVFWDVTRKRPAVVLSEMKSERRRGEIPYFEDWYKQREYDIHRINKEGASFESCGDVAIQPKRQILWAGHGFRSDAAAHAALAQIAKRPVVALRLVNDHFYHLDTCFSILNDDTVAIAPVAFESEGLALIRAGFSNVIEVDSREAIANFACNCHCPNGKDIILNRGATLFVRELQRRNFAVHEVDTSEFVKSGGSVYCMKMMVY
jgi:N-dimethylarginine dimethylaminohydrolase